MEVFQSQAGSQAEGICMMQVMGIGIRGARNQILKLSQMEVLISQSHWLNQRDFLTLNLAGVISAIVINLLLTFITWTLGMNL